MALRWYVSTRTVVPTCTFCPETVPKPLLASSPTLRLPFQGHFKAAAPLRSLGEARGSRSDAGGLFAALCILNCVCIAYWCVLVRTGALLVVFGCYFFISRDCIAVFIAVLGVIEAVLRRF